MPLLEKAFENPTLQNGPLFLLVTEMLVSWEKKASGESKGHTDVFQGLVADFWEELSIAFTRHTDSEEASPQALEGIAALLQVSLLIFRLKIDSGRSMRLSLFEQM